MSGTFGSLGVGDDFVASLAEGAEAICLAVEPFNEQIPRDKSFGSDDGDDVVGMDSILGK